MKTKLIFALVAALTSTAFAALQTPLPEFKNDKQLAEWRAEKAVVSNSQKYAAEESAFYTGKPYVASSGGYAFKYRSYNPELARWTAEDPSGFPDGANNSLYVNNSPGGNFDDVGLTGKSVLWATFTNLFGNGEYSDSTHAYSYIDSFTNQYNSTKHSMNSWDSSHNSSDGLYLSDGDRFDKHVFSTWQSFFAEVSGYTEVYVMCHGSFVNGDYRAHKDRADTIGLGHGSFSGRGTNFVMATCYSGNASFANMRGIDGTDPAGYLLDLGMGETDIGTVLPQMGDQTKTTLFE